MVTTKRIPPWLAGLRFDAPAHHIVLEDHLATIEAATARRDRLTAQIEVLLAGWALAPVVHALQSLRGMALVSAATVIAELGDITRFANPRQLMAYLGLVPSEQSTGPTRHQGSITKAGNATARRMLIEAAWSTRFPARISREQLLRQEALPKPVRDIAWKAQLRLKRPVSKASHGWKVDHHGSHRHRTRTGRVRLGHRLPAAAAVELRTATGPTGHQPKERKADLTPPWPWVRPEARSRQENPRIHCQPGHLSDAGF